MNLNGINHGNDKIQLDDEYGRYLLSLLLSFDLKERGDRYMFRNNRSWLKYR